MPNIHKPIDLRAPGAIDDLLAFHRARFGCAHMENDPPAGPPADPPKPAPPAPKAPDAGGDDKPLGPGGEKALQAERDARKALEATVKQMQDAQAKQADALAKALGLKPEETSDADKLAGQVTDLSGQVGALLKTNLVLTIGKGLSEDDQKILAGLPDEATMRTVAARLAEAAKPSGRPKADPPSDGGGRPAPSVDMPGLPRLRAAYEAAENN
jgi:colicin import membrane protein